MSNITVKLQIPLDKVLRDAINKHAHELGFGSVQDFTRVMYSTVIRDKMQFSLTSEQVHLSPAAEARYEKMLKAHGEDKKARKVKTFTDVEAFLAEL